MEPRRCVAALPSDVRKVSDLPGRPDRLGLCPCLGRSPLELLNSCPVGRSHHRTSDGTAEPKAAFMNLSGMKSGGAGGFAGIEFGSFFDRRAGLAKIRAVILNRFEILFDAVENFID
ncbi:MAG: hypothetical protein QOF62_1122 [Pyrinomonadaceae bacterium]|nr:hypothetical protein [Pyrinomonadaceae bacterium]